MGNFCQQVLKPLGSYTWVFTAFQQGKPYPLIYLKPEKGPLFGRNLTSIGHYKCREYARGKKLMFVNLIITLKADATSLECVLAYESHE